MKRKRVKISVCKTKKSSKSKRTRNSRACHVKTSETIHSDWSSPVGVQVPVPSEESGREELLKARKEGR
jgi:hypothetical protein